MNRASLPSRNRAVALSFASMVALSTAMVGVPALAQSTASGSTFGSRFDLGGRVVGTIAPDPDGAGPRTYAAVRNTYDSAGRLIKVEKGELSTWKPESIEPVNWGTSFAVTTVLAISYDSLGRKVKETVTGSDAVVVSVTQYSYDAAGRLECTAVRMDPAQWGAQPDACVPQLYGPNGPDRITRNKYDKAGQLLQVRKAVGTSIETADVTYTYTDNGKKKFVIDANGNRAELRYDGYDRQERWVFPSTTRPSAYDASDPETTALLTAGGLNENDYEAYGYDANGNRTSLRKRDGSVLTYEYDALNRMTRKVVPDRAGLASTHERPVYYGYDSRGLQTYARFDSASGEGVTNVYDGLGRLTSATEAMDGQSRTLSYQYDANGNRTRITWPDAAYITTLFDGLDRQAFLVDAGGGYMTSWTYTAGGQPGSFTRSAAAFDQTFGYDNVGRLSSLAVVQGQTASQVAWSFTRNPAGQITGETRDNDAYAWTGHFNVNRGYTTNGLNQYTGAGTASFCYDANGNLTADGTSVYLYDIENRLVEKRVQTNTTCTALSYTGSLQASLRYDPLGRLHEVTGGTTTRFLYDGDALVGEYNTSGTLLHRYMHGSDTGADDPVIWFQGSSAVAANARYLYADPRGSIVLVGDAAGNAVAINTYDEYGIPGSNQGRFQYTGQVWLPELGMYHYKARIYSPTLGRFLQTDPIGYDDQVNLYAYVGNDPINGVDPSGRATVCTIQDHGTLACVGVDADGDGNAHNKGDRLTPGQTSRIQNDFRGAIIANAGGDISGFGKDVKGDASSDDKAMTRVTSQFVGASVKGEAAKLWSNITYIWAGKSSYMFGTGNYYARQTLNSPDRGPMVLGRDVGWFSGRLYDHPSDLARAMLHEMGHTASPLIPESRVDMQARGWLKVYGLDGGGCSAVGLGGYGGGFPGC